MASGSFLKYLILPKPALFGTLTQEYVYVGVAVVITAPFTFNCVVGLHPPVTQLCALKMNSGHRSSKSNVLQMGVVPCTVYSKSQSSMFDGTHTKSAEKIPFRQLVPTIYCNVLHPTHATQYLPAILPDVQGAQV